MKYSKIMIAVFTLIFLNIKPIFAKEFGYFSPSKKTDHLVQLCMEKIAAQYNIHCFVGNINNIPAYRDFMTYGNQSDKNRGFNALENLKIIGLDLESIRESRNFSNNSLYFAFLGFSEDSSFNAHNPVITAELSVMQINEGRAGIDRQWVPKEIIDKIKSIVESSLPLIDKESQEGKLFIANLNQQAEKRKKEKAIHDEQLKVASRPKCSFISFTGIVVGGGLSDLQTIKNERNKSDLLARYPLRCSPSAISQTYVCSGAAFISRKEGHIIDWTNDAYQIVTPIDLMIGRKDTMVYINRSDAVCLNKQLPSLDFSENMINFLRSHNRYR